MTKDAASHDHNIQFDFAKRDYQKDKNPYADITFPSALVKKGEDRSEQRKQPQDSRPGRFQSETRATVPTKEGSRHAAYTQTSARSAPRQQRPQDSEQLAKGNAQDSSNIKQPSETQPSRSTQRGRPKESTDSAAMQFRNGFGRQELIPKVEQAVNPMMPGQTRGAMNPPNVYPTAYHHPHDPIPSSINAENVSETQVPREDLSSPRHTIPSGKPSEQLSVENDNHSSSTLPQGSKQIKVFASELSFAKEESAVHPTHKPSPVTPHEPYRLAVVPRDMFRSQTQLVGGRSYPDQNRPQGPMTAHMPGVYSSSQQIRVKQEEESETELLNVIKKKSERIAVLDAECQHLKTAYKGLQDELALEVQKYLSLQKRHQQDEQNWRTSLTNVREWSEKVKERQSSASQVVTELQKSFENGKITVNSSIAELSREVKDMQSENIAKFEEELASHTSTVSNLKDGINSIKAELQAEYSSYEQLKAVSTTNTILSEERDTLTKRCKKLEEKLQGFEKQLNPSLETMSTHLAELTKRTETSPKEFLLKYQDELHGKLLTAEKNRTSLQHRLETAEATKDAYETKVDDIKDHLRTHGCKGDDLETMVDNLLVKHQNELEDRARKLDRVSRDSEERTLRSSKEIASLQKEVDSLKPKLEEAEKRVRQAQSESVDQRNSLMSEHNLALNELHNEVKGLKNEKDKFSGLLEQGQTDKRELLDQISHLRVEVKNKESQLHASEKREESLDTQLRSAKQNLEGSYGDTGAYQQTKAELDSKQKEIARLESELRNVNARCTQASEQLGSCEIRTSQLEKELNDTKLQSNEMIELANQQSKDLSRGKIAEQANKIKSLQTRNDKLAEDHGKQQESINRLQAVVKTYQEEFGSLPSESMQTAQPDESSSLSDISDYDRPVKETASTSKVKGIGSRSENSFPSKGSQANRVEVNRPFKPPTLSSVEQPEQSTGSMRKSTRGQQEEEFESPPLDEEAFYDEVMAVQQQPFKQVATSPEHERSAKKAKVGHVSGLGHEESHQDIESSLVTSSKRTAERVNMLKDSKDSASSTRLSRTASTSGTRIYGKANKKKEKQGHS